MSAGWEAERRLATVEEKVRALEADRDDLVTKVELGPIRSIVYGLVGTILLAFAVAVTTLVMRH